jgi:hypothetical protein
MYVLIGMFIGKVTGGFDLARKSAKLWPLERKIIDWDRVVRMANGDTLEAGPPEFIDAPRTDTSTATYQH